MIRPATVSDFWLAIALLCLLALPASLIALLFSGVRRQAKWMAVASAAGFVVTFVAFGLSSTKEAEMNKVATTLGVRDSADRRAAEQAGVADPTLWQLRREAAAAKARTKLRTPKPSKTMQPPKPSKKLRPSKPSKKLLMRS